MCDPVSIGGAALSGAGILSNMMGASQQASARQQAINAEQQRQQGWQNKSTTLFNNTLPLASRESQDAAAKTAADTRYTRDAGVIDGSASVANPASGVSSTGEGQSQIARAVGTALTRGKQHARAAADVSGVGDATSKLGIDLAHAGQWQSIFGNNMQHSAAILPAELQDANGAGAGMRGLGTVLGTAGQAAGLYGMSAGAPTWGSLFGTGAPISSTVAGPTQPGFFTRAFGG